MKKTAKQIIWQLLVEVGKLFPDFLLHQLCAIAFASRQSEHNAKQHLKTLLAIQSRLRWFIDQQAILYDAGFHPKHRLTAYHGFFVERIKASDEVLDIGCGYGALALSIARTNAKVTGIDIDPANIDKARLKSNHKNISYMVGDITSSLPPGSFNVIVMSNVLEHLESRQEILRSLVEEYHPRVILIRVPMINRHWGVPLRQELGLPHFSDPTHCVEYTLESFMDEMKGAELQPLFYKIIWGEIWAEIVVGSSSEAL